MNRRSFLSYSSINLIIGLGVAQPLLLPAKLKAFPNIGALRIIASLSVSIFEAYQVGIGADKRSQFLSLSQAMLREIEDNQSIILDEISTFESAVTSTIEKNEIRQQNSSLLAFVKQYNRISQSGSAEPISYISPELDRLVYQIGAYSQNNYTSFLLGTCLQLLIYEKSIRRELILAAMWEQKKAIFKFAHDKDRVNSVDFSIEKLKKKEAGVSFVKKVPSPLEVVRFATIYRSDDSEKIKARSVSVEWKITDGQLISRVQSAVKLSSVAEMGLGFSDKSARKLLTSSGDQIIIEAYPSKILSEFRCIKASGWKPALNFPKFKSDDLFSATEANYLSKAANIALCMEANFRKMEESRIKVLEEIETAMLLRDTSLKLREMLSNA